MKEKQIHIRADDELLQKLEYLMRINGYRSLSDTIRRIVEKEYRKESASNEELVEWIEDQYFHSVAEGHSQEAIVYHNGALKNVVRHINGDD
jgi:metal-responsive CopG/Arc/MetJ family transcriptional regulator